MATTKKKSATRKVVDKLLGKDVRLGVLCKDIVTGFEGIAIAKTEWLSGCVRFTLQPQDISKEGAPKDSQAFDVEQLVVVGNGVQIKKQETGGPKPEVSRAKDPVR
jgi:predicted extracellular nuclease